jgi:hypothetical protein
MNDKKPAKKTVAVDKPEFSGRVNGMSVAASGASVQFEVANKKNESRSYKLDSANAGGLALMASMLTAAYVGGKKVTVTGAANGEGMAIASEIRFGVKPKAPKVKAPKPPKRVKGPVAEAQAPA